MTETQRKIGLLACLVTIVLAVLDTQIVSAASFPIVHDLDPDHGVVDISWLASAFSLASAAMLPLYGRLCDALGAKRVFLGALATFLTGSALCGAARSIDWLIASRALQGVGGGGLMSVTMVVIAQLKDPGEKKNKGAGIGGIIGGGGMAVGPWLGGFLADHASWRWAFYINLPLGIAALAAGVVVLKLPRHTTSRAIDFTGAALAAAFSTALLLITQWGGKQYAWTSPQILGLALAFLGALTLFLRRQFTAAEPILPPSLFRVPELRLGFAIQGLMGAAMVGAMYYVLVYLQLARHVNSSAAGLYLIPMAAGIMAVGVATGRLGERGWSERTFVLSGSAVTTAAFLLLATTGTHTSLWQLRGALLLVGLGFGQLLGQLIQLVQQAAPGHQLGVATTAIRFFQTLGMALGVALFGSLIDRLYDGPGDVGSLAALRGAARTAGVTAYVSAMDTVFLCGAGVMTLCLLLALRLPKARPVAAERQPEKTLAA
ncbi:EmrB/QacA subfamily drug resistance transporter [Streptomyces griseochromogenes]|uniref:EmrB/QacA subfamily drug resistance transporter n=1 Tax=Streptomyces griseochromogenes TaxID=68214 RepID=A0A1B1BB38_9ACTN|nr:MFS transporter [Streptomyces griseochromogenes]ANP56045.1 EmrB/QacA subfamily drug resistance transporter [Streptomyces griseochromogenes]MBP2051103.1 EmrB/QacA subfamily drug resistance transporter [Streptomyces griseochromogenes]